ncbi:swim zinc finger domain protein [Beauveria brongniartii RCEF 3172]|uniref:Swim zinc finger domain protein n=1 Tax=Beauveria brongniartii RCEF 3172 TaxID=1081107 RepID=A0A166WEK9_9HYPO|nr:swim zinc finger domain protein [Beauveria brongniartii RCEF 3172]
MPEMTTWTFGVEIEAVVRPHTPRPPLDAALYYRKLAAALVKRGLQAEADDLLSGNRRRSESYDKWWITRDGSLGTYSDAISLEAVSPIFEVRRDWATEIDTFWASMRAVFHMPDRNTKCGSHVHIAPGRGKHFRPVTLKKMAFGIAIFEPLVLQLLPEYRADNQYCQPNTKNSPRLSACRGNKEQILELIKTASSSAAIRDIMQKDRYVIWNFDNTLPNKSGTIEFRGGRMLRGEIRTKRWITFAVCFLRAVVEMKDLNRRGTYGLPIWTPQALYEKVKEEARKLSLDRHLPASYTVLNESSIPAPP